MGSRSSGTSAPYGQACMHCFKSKCKCISRPEGDGCERCHRLNKECHPSDSIRRRHSSKNPNPNTRIAQLEGKLDGLLSLLQTVSNCTDSSSALQKALGEKGVTVHGRPQQQNTSAESLTTTPTSTSETVTQCTVTTDTDESAEVPLTATSPPISLTDSPGIDNLSNHCSPPFEPSPDEAEASLSAFRSQLLPYLPFIHLPTNLTAEQLRRDKPFLFRAIFAVTSNSAQQKLARGRELKQILARTALLENQSSIDLLLGLLTYVAWGYDQFLTGSGTLSRLVLMAMSLAYDLRLNKPLSPDVHMVGPLGLGYEGCDRDALQETDQRCLEPQRALLGCFLLSSIISIYFVQTDAMRWTPRMEESLRTIGANKDCPSDVALAYQVRVQLLAQRAVQAREQQDMYHAHIPTASAATPPATFLYLKALQTQLQDLKRSLPLGLQQQDILMAHTHYIELCINETAHTANSDAPLLPASAASCSGSNLPGFERMECLWGSLNAIKSWLDVFFTLSLPLNLGLSFLFWAQLPRCLVVLCRLSTYTDPAWDRQAVRNTVDLLLSLDQVVERLELASSETFERSNDDLFMRLPKFARMFRAWARAKVASEEVETESWPYSGVTSGDCEMVDQNQVLMQSIDFGNDMWLEEIFGRR